MSDMSDMSENEHHSKQEQLAREITLFGFAALALNGLIGAGIFTLPAKTAAVVMNFSPWLILIAGVLIFTCIISFGSAASYFKGTGGPVLYATTAFNPFVGFQTGWLLYLGRAAAFAANANVMTAYMGFFMPAMNVGALKVVMLFLICAFFTVVNYNGVKQGMGTVNLLTFLKVVPLLFLVLYGLSYLKVKTFSPVDLPDYQSFSTGFLLLIYAFLGFEGAVIPAAEGKNPKRDIPRALIVTTVITTILYFFIQAVCFGVAPKLAESTRPIADVAQIMWGSVGGAVISFVAFFSISGNLSSIMLTAPRMTYAMARDHTLPKFFAEVNPKSQTPSSSILFMGIFTFALASSGTFVFLAVMSSLSRMIGYGIVIASLPFLKKKMPDNKDALELPGGMTIPAIGFILCMWLAFTASLKVWALTGFLFLLGTGLYFFSRAQKYQEEEG